MIAVNDGTGRVSGCAAGASRVAAGVSLTLDVRAPNRLQPVTTSRVDSMATNRACPNHDPPERDCLANVQTPDDRVACLPDRFVILTTGLAADPRPPRTVASSFAGNPQPIRDVPQTWRFSPRALLRLTTPCCAAP